MYCIKIYSIHCNNIVLSPPGMLLSQFQNGLHFSVDSPVLWSSSAVLEPFMVLFFLHNRHPMNMLKTMAEIAITRKRIATTIHTVCDPSDFEVWSTVALPGVWHTVIVVAKGHKIVTVSVSAVHRAWLFAMEQREACSDSLSLRRNS